MIAVRIAIELDPPGSAPGDDPFSMFSGWGDQLVWLAVLVPIAVLVFFVGSRRFRSQLGSASIVPKGRDRFVAGGGPRRDATWRETVDRLEAKPATPIAQARSGPVRVEAEIVRASGNLGGPPGRECVWRNRAGAGSQTAVGADLLIVADASGRCGVEQLETARVIAPTERAGAHYESTSLYIGDRVEVIARFEPEVVGEHEDPSMLVYGTLGAHGPVDIRVVERPAPPEPEAEAAEDAEEAPAEPEPADPEPSDEP